MFYWNNGSYALSDKQQAAMIMMIYGGVAAREINRWRNRIELFGARDRLCVCRRTEGQTNSQIV